jgi:hypothetical protein
MVAGPSQEAAPEAGFAAPPETVSADQRHPYAGVYPVWSWFITPQDMAGKYDYLKGQHLFAKWSELKPDENGPYQWDVLDNRARERLGDLEDKVLYLQLNAEWPDWLYKHVAKASFTNRGINPPQFWDPVYVDLYKQFINDVAQHVAQSDYKDKIVFVRAQYNALNPESITPWGHFDYADYQSTSSGHLYQVDFTQDIGNQYAKEIVQIYIDAFKPLGIEVMSKPFGSTQNERQFAQELVTMGAGFFNTNSTPNPIGRQEMLLFSKVERQSRSYTEPYNAAGVRDNPLQWLYWRTLSDLYQGVEFISYYGDDIIIGEYDDIFEFANKYAGWYREPERSPGAWIAFRGVENPSDNLWAGGHLEGNYEYLVSQIEPADSLDLYAYPGNGETDEFNLNPMSKQVTNLGPKSQKEGIWARQTNGQPIYLDFNDTFASSLTGAIAVRVSYLDNDSGKFQLSFQDAAGQLQTHTVQKSNTQSWQDEVITIVDYQFNNGLEKNADILLQAAGDGDDIFHMVEITRSDIPAPPTPTDEPTSVPTDEPTSVPTGEPTPAAITLAVNGPAVVAPGETFTINVEARNITGEGIYGAQLEMNYNSTLITVSNLQVNPDLFYVLRSAIDETNGRISLVASRQGRVPGLIGDNTLLTFEVTAGDTSATTELTIENHKISDPQAQSVEASTQGHTLSIGDAVPEPTDEPTPEPTDEPTPEPTDEPTPEPTDEPTPEPTDEPTMADVAGQVIVAGRTNNNWSGASVTVEYNGQIGGQETSTTDEGGGFWFDDMQTNAQATITANAPGYLPAACTMPAFTAPETTLLPVTLLSGDIVEDENVIVDVTDAVAVGNSFDQTGSDLPADINLDGVVDIFDLVLVSINFGETGPQEWVCQ